MMKRGRMSNCGMGRAFVAALAAVAILACASATYKGGIFENDQTIYRVDPPRGGWERISAGDADVAFWNERLSAFIMVNSTCDQYRDAPVSILANHLFIGIEKKLFSVQEERPLDGRDAVYTELTGKLDGHPVKVAAYTLVKNYCTYDLSYSADPKHFDEGLPAFHELARKFRVLRRKKK